MLSIQWTDLGGGGRGRSDYQDKKKENRRKTIIKIKLKINEIKNKDTRVKITIPEVVFLKGPISRKLLSVVINKNRDKM